MAEFAFPEQRLPGYSRSSASQASTLSHHTVTSETFAFIHHALHTSPIFQSLQSSAKMPSAKGKPTDPKLREKVVESAFPDSFPCLSLHQSIYLSIHLTNYAQRSSNSRTKMARERAKWPLGRYLSPPFHLTHCTQSASADSKRHRQRKSPKNTKPRVVSTKTKPAAKISP
jgi:hypothetical protein